MNQPGLTAAKIILLLGSILGSIMLGSHLTLKQVKISIEAELARVKREIGGSQLAAPAPIPESPRKK